MRATIPEQAAGSASAAPPPRRKRPMLNVLLALAAVLALLIVAFVIVVSRQPTDFHIARTATIDASPEELFAQVNDFHNWGAWSPYDKRDPAMKKTYDGPRTGVGASYAWNGNSNVGEGRSTIIESRPHELIRIKLEFIRPFTATHTADFTFQPQGQRTDVTWALDGKYNFVSKAMCLFMDMDKMVGGDFEQGLANLKAVVEKSDAGSRQPGEAAPLTKS
jgi:hypothetical protein